MDRAPDRPPLSGLGDPPKPAVVGSNPTGPALRIDNLSKHVSSRGACYGVDAR